MRPCTKHIAVKYHHFRKVVKDKILTIKRIDTKCQKVDIFTKQLPLQSFETLRASIMGWMWFLTRIGAVETEESIQCQLAMKWNHPQTIVHKGVWHIPVQKGKSTHCPMWVHMYIRGTAARKYISCDVPPYVIKYEHLVCCVGRLQPFTGQQTGTTHVKGKVSRTEHCREKNE